MRKQVAIVLVMLFGILMALESLKEEWSFFSSSISSDDEANLSTEDDNLTASANDDLTGKTLEPSTSSPTSNSPTVMMTQIPTTIQPTLSMGTLQPTSGSPTSKTPTMPTQAPTLKPTLSADAVRDQCVKRKITSARPALIWNCTRPVNATYLEDDELYPESKIPPILLSGETQVTLLRGDNWGQLCNKLGMFAGMLLRMRQRNQRDTILALSTVYSETAWALD